tara:strand:- start:274 stop:864 length:591 start_codon:yes stop_codon:yes gene_type:complete
MDFENVKLDDYCLNLELHKSMFFIDMLKDTYEFTLKGDQVEIFKKLKNGISEPTTRKGLIYSIQVEMAEKYKYRSIKDKDSRNLSKKEKSIQRFFRQFEGIDSIHQAIDNMVYLEKRMKRQPVIVPKQPPQKIIVADATPKNPDFGGWEEDEEELDEDEEVNELGENKKLVLKNALEKECLSARTELFRPAWRPPR